MTAKPNAGDCDRGYICNPCFRAIAAQARLSPPEEERSGMDENDVVQILCRVFEDAMDEGGAYGQWRAWYKPADWFHRSRAFGAFLYTLLEPIRTERDAARSALKDSFDKAYDLACLLNVDRPSAQPRRVNEVEKY